MAEYIEREALVERWKRRLKYMVADEDGEYPINFKIVVDALEREPAADVVEVVRCRDCKYISAPTERGNFLCGRKMLGLVRPDDFCSFGERMDGDSNA